MTVNQSAPSHCLYSSLICFVSVFSNDSESLTAKDLPKPFSEFYHRPSALIVRLQILLQQGISEPACYGNVV